LIDLVPFRFGKIKLPGLAPRPKLRLHEPEAEEIDEDFEERIDRILAKISAQGTGSLTKDEQRLLETASRRAQRKRRVPSD
jgi:hypothetical protein